MTAASRRVLVGVISDTHGLLDSRVRDVFSGVDAIVHAGDIGTCEVLHELAELAPVYAVLGNCDPWGLDPALAIQNRFELGGVTFSVAHRPADLVPPLADVNICGHLHVASIDQDGGCMHLNPGSASTPRDELGPSVALVLIGGGRVIATRIVRLDAASGSGMPISE